MSLYKYAQWSYAIAEEYRQLVSNEDADALRAELRDAGEANWLTWVAKNQVPLLSYLADTAAKRRTRKQWADPVLRRRICLVAYRHARLAGLVLDAADQLGSGGGYRDTCLTAAHSALDVLQASHWIWPFGGVPPFPTWGTIENPDCSESSGGPLV